MHPISFSIRVITLIYIIMFPLCFEAQKETVLWSNSVKNVEMPNSMVCNVSGSRGCHEMKDMLMLRCG
eukprot:m.1311919 g.1311919  ORF g.1311919 m.1311919 type:complete len:68 (-) comp24829_c1_seq58:83-286(-)